MLAPSRRSAYRLLYTSANSRPQCSRARPIPPHLAINHLQRTSHVLSFQLSGTAEAHQADRNSNSNRNLHPKGVDPALFESSTSEYEDAASALFHDPWHSGPTQLLLSLLERSNKDATTTLQELQKLETVLEHRSEYARAARQCAVQGDTKGCLSWLDNVPKFSCIPAESIQERDEACAHVAAALTTLVNGAATESYLVCLALLKVVGKGYLMSVDKTGQAIYHSLNWLLRHGEILDQREGQEWTWELWKSVVKAAIKAEAAAAVIPTPSTSKVTLDQSSRGLFWRLDRLYNGAVRTLVLSGRYEAALVWVQNSESFLSNECCSGTKLYPITWRIFLEEVLDYESPASAQVKSHAGVLVNTLNEITSGRAEVDSLVREGRNLALGKNDAVLLDGRLEDDLHDLLEEGDVRGGISVLHQALTDVMPTPRWGHLPGARDLAEIREAISKAAEPRQKEELQHFLDDLERSRGGKGLAHFSYMVQLTQAEQREDCVSFCISTFQSTDVEQLALLVDEAAFKGVIEASRESNKLRYSKYANYLALKNLVYMCEDDFFKMHKLYRAWHQSALHHISDSEPKAASTEEGFDLAHLFSTGADLSELGDGPPILTYQVPPTARPSILHFNLFLKMLPRALAFSTLKGSPSTRNKLKTDNLRGRLIDLGFNTLQEVQRSQLEPNIATWTVLLSLLARNVNAIPPEQEQSNNLQGGEEDSPQALEPEQYEKQWNGIWKLAHALGMGMNEKQDKSSSVTISTTRSTAKDGDAEKPSTLPKASAITYAELIYAFLMVTPDRGGPCLEEASRVKSWLQADKEAISSLNRQSSDHVNRILGVLEKEQATLEERAEFTRQRESGQVTKLEERLKLMP